MLVVVCVCVCWFEVWGPFGSPLHMYYRTGPTKRFYDVCLACFCRKKRYNDHIKILQAERIQS